MESTERKKHYTAEGALLLTTLIWGGTFALIKSALGFVSPLMFITVRFGVAALVMLPFVYKRLASASRKHWKPALILGLIYFVSYAAQTAGLKQTTATKSAFITGLFVIFTPLFQTILQKRLPGKASYAAIFLAVTGVMLLASKGDSMLDVVFMIGENFTFGDFLTLCCAVLYAVYIVYLDMISGEIDYLFLAFVQIAFTALSGGLFTWLLNAGGIEAVRFSLVPETVYALLYTALIATTITTILQTKFQPAVSPTRASLIFSMEPIFAAIFAFIILSERITAFGAVGAVCIICGLLTAEFFGKD